MSLRTRLILSFLLIIVICLGISALSVSLVLQHYRDQVIMIRLDDMTRPISNQIRNLLKGQTSLLQVMNNLQQLSDDSNSFILLVNEKGELVRQVSPDNKGQPLEVLSGFPHGISQPTHGVFTTTSGQKFVYSAYPLGKSGETILPRPQTMVLCQPQNDLMFVVAGVINPFIRAGIVALLISLILAFFLSRSVYRPIQDLSRAAGKIARGQYGEAVPVAGPAEVKKLAGSFNEMTGKVKESHDQLRHFVADVSHQLKSPLTSIQGFAQAIQDGTAGDEATRMKAARIIEDESKRMLRQVNELLEFSRMQAGQIKIVKERVDIKEILLHSQEIYALRLEEKKIKLKSKIAAPAAVTGDADRLEDVFNNLIDNAIKNTPPQGEIEIDMRSEGKFLEVTVSDNGFGIPPEQLPHVFERFQTSSGLRTGFGLGLAIAREIILAHGGNIKAFSNPGEGAKFVVTLPVEAAKK